MNIVVVEAGNPMVKEGMAEAEEHEMEAEGGTEAVSPPIPARSGQDPSSPRTED